MKILVIIFLKDHNMNKIYLTSYRLNKLKSINKIFNFCLDNNIFGIEFSGGKYHRNILQKLKKEEKINYLFHNYFPVPKKSFVINLASNDKQIEKKSLNHVLNSIKLSKKLKLKFFSFHAGFLYDPPENSLGKKVKKMKLFDRDEALNRFIKNLKIISKFGKKNNVLPLVENNNIDIDELKTFGQSTVLMADIDETKEIMNSINNNLGILVDLGHLNVASKSLNFCKKNYLKICKKWIYGYQFSSNDGFKDQNRLIRANNWFWPYIKKNLSYYSLEVNSINFEKIKKNINLIKRKIS